MALPSLSGLMVLAAAMVTAPSAQAGIYCDMARKLCDLIPVTFAVEKCERMADDICRKEAEGRRAEAKELYEKAVREYQS